MQLIFLYVVEATFISWFISSLLDIEKKRWVYKGLLFTFSLFVIMVCKEINVYSVYASIIIILGCISISLPFVSNKIEEILFVSCLEILISYCIIIGIGILNSTNDVRFILLSKVVTYILMYLTIYFIKRAEFSLQRTVYFGLSFIIFVFYLLIQYLLQLYLESDIRISDFLVFLGLLLFCIIMIMLTIRSISKLNKREKEYNELLQEKKTEEVITYLYNEIKITKHDLKHEYALLKYYLEEKDIKSIEQIIQQNNLKVDDIPVLIQSENALLNTIINNKIIESYSKKIKVDCKLLVDKHINITDYDLNHLLLNMMDNAIENCTSDGEISINIIQENKLLHIWISNSIKESSLERKLKTTKDGRYHGFGLKSMRQICKKYNGKINIEEKNNRFSIETTLYLK